MKSIPDQIEYIETQIRLARQKLCWLYETQPEFETLRNTLENRIAILQVELNRLKKKVAP